MELVLLANLFFQYFRYRWVCTNWGEIQRSLHVSIPLPIHQNHLTRLQGTSIAQQRWPIFIYKWSSGNIWCGNDQRDWSWPSNKHLHPRFIKMAVDQINYRNWLGNIYSKVHFESRPDSGEFYNSSVFFLPSLIVSHFSFHRSQGILLLAIQHTQISGLLDLALNN